MEDHDVRYQGWPATAPNHGATAPDGGIRAEDGGATGLNDEASAPEVV